jgi:hypothetical protein
MTVSIPVGLVVQTVLTGVVGWLVKLVLDTLKNYSDESKAWRKKMDDKVDGIGDATQATMRTTILHYCEKYITRDWITSEELSSLLDMHKKYTVINPKNGFIDAYVERVKQLEIHEI